MVSKKDHSAYSTQDYFSKVSQPGLSSLNIPTYVCKVMRTLPRNMSYDKKVERFIFKSNGLNTYPIILT